MIDITGEIPGIYISKYNSCNQYEKSIIIMNIISDVLKPETSHDISLLLADLNISTMIVKLKNP